MNVKDLRSIVTNMNAKPTLPVSVRVNFGDDAKSYTMADITSFNQFTDVFLLNAKVEYPEIDKLMQFRQWLVEETERFQEQAKADNASNEGSHYDRGHAAAFISARAKLEELFDYWDCR